MPMCRPISRQKWNVACRSASISRRHPKRSFQRNGSSTIAESTYRKSSFAMSKRPWIWFIRRSARLPCSPAQPSSEKVLMSRSVSS